MYNPWGEDLKESAKALLTIKESVLEVLFNGKIYNIESSKNEILMLIDQHSGIDYIVDDGEGLVGVATRVQWGGNYRTFTIRESRHTGSKTEYEKRKHALRLIHKDSSYIYPALTMQAYFDNKEDNNLLSLAITRTRDLYDFIEKYYDDSTRVRRNSSDNDFIYVRWRDLEKELYGEVYYNGTMHVQKLMGWGDH